MADIDCSRRTNVAKKRNMTTPKEINNLRGKSKDHDPKSPHPNRIQQKHKGTMKHPCKLGDKTYKQTEYSKILMRVHIGEKPYQCKACDKCFTQKEKLRKHIFTHTEEKPSKQNYVTGILLQYYLLLCLTLVRHIMGTSRRKTRHLLI